MKYLFCFCVVGTGLMLILILYNLLCGQVWRVAHLCYVCNGNGIDRGDSEFDCERCKGTGLLICESYSTKWETIVWAKPLWFRWTTKKMLS